MHLVEYLIPIVLGFVINLQCVPMPRSFDTMPSRTTRNPEENEGYDGGDMVRPPFDISSKGRGVAIRPASVYRWAGGVVPYEFASNITASNTLFVVDQMRAMENLTKVNNTQCISFRPRNASDTKFITIFNGSGCTAPVGNWGSYVGVRPVSLLHGTYSTCMISGIVQHELMHVLGFYHEQSRPDRDSYVTIYWANIQSGYAFAFDKYNDTDVDTQMTQYDYQSVMHYERDAFAINYSAPTITPTQNTSAFIGQRVQLSPIDILEIQRYYGCIPTPNTTTTSTTSTTSSTTSTTSVTTTTTTTSTTSATTTTTTSATTTTTTSAKTTSTSNNGAESKEKSSAASPDALTIGLAVGISGLLALCICCGLIALGLNRTCRKELPEIDGTKLNTQTTSNPQAMSLKQPPPPPPRSLLPPHQPIRGNRTLDLRYAAWHQNP